MGTYLHPKLNSRFLGSLIIGLIGAAVLIPVPTLAEGAPAATHQYAPPSCPDSMKNKDTAECSYASGVKVQCTFYQGNPGGGSVYGTNVISIYVCKNPDQTSTFCDSGTGSAIMTDGCKVMASTWKYGEPFKEEDILWSKSKLETVGLTTETTCENGNTNCSGVTTNVIDDIIGEGMVKVAFFILTFSSTLLGWIGSAFNWVVVHTIFRFGDYFGTSESMVIAWGVLRDVGNIILLFGFILMGLLSILNLHDYSVKKTIPGLIIFAVLLNFSLFASQVVIDVSNAFASVFYEQASGQCDAGVSIEDCVKDGSKGGISALIIQQAGVSSAFNIDSEKNGELSPLGRGVLFLGLAMFVTVSALVLLAATVMLVARAVFLCFLMVVSPIGFAGMAIPPLKKHAQRWWKELMSQAFFAPVFLLLIFVSLKLTEVLSSGVQGPDKGLANALAGGQFGGMGIIVTFMVIIGFMVISLTAAKSMAGSSSQMALNAAGKIGGAAVFGGGAFVARRTAGAGSAWLGHELTKGRLRGWSQNNPNLARMAYGVAKKGSESSFDARKTKIVGQAAKFVGTDLGKPAKGGEHGYHGIEEKAVKERTEFFGKLSPSDQQMQAANQVKKELDEYKETAKKRAEADNKRIEEMQKKLDEARANNDSPEKIETLEAALKQLVDASSAKTKTEQKEIKKMEGKHKALEAQAKTEMTLNFTQNLSGIYIPGSVGYHADHEAAEKIRKDATKDATEKALDELKKQLKKAQEKEDDHDGDDHAHAPAAAHAPVAHAPASPAADNHGGGDNHAHHN